MLLTEDKLLNIVNRYGGDLTLLSDGRVAGRSRKCVTVTVLYALHHPERIEEYPSSFSDFVWRSLTFLRSIKRQIGEGIHTLSGNNSRVEEYLTELYNLWEERYGKKTIIVKGMRSIEYVLNEQIPSLVYDILEEGDK